VVPWFCYNVVFFMLKWVGINLYLDNRCLLIKYDQLRMLTAMTQPLFDGLASFPHLLSTNDKSTHPCLTTVQKRMWKWNTTATSRTSRHAFTSQSPVEEALLQMSFRILVKRLRPLCLFYSEFNNVILLSCLYFEHCLCYIHL
jgi:hypothetical protein